MLTNEHAAARGFVQETAQGLVFEIGNGWLTRRIQCMDGKIGTASLEHGLNGEEYLEETVQEFAIELARNQERLTLSFRDLEYVGHETPRWDDDERLLRIDLEGRLDGARLRVSLFYQARRNTNYLRKWLEIYPCDSDWIIEWVTLENLRFKEPVEGVIPYPRYPRRFANGEDNVHSEPDKVNTSEANKRFLFGDEARAVVTYWGFNEGLFFFTDSILGKEAFRRPDGLVMRQMEYAPVRVGLRTGTATIGAYGGPPEIGFKRYNEYLLENWCVIGQKSMPVSWSTWFITLEGDRPVQSNYDRELLLCYLELLKDAGFYNVLHLDLGWEAGKPMEVDTSRFPNGMEEIWRKAKDYGIDMAYWVNPFSASYWVSDFEKERPEWHVPGQVSRRSGAHALCIMTPYYEHVENAFLRLVKEMNARIIYWDGSDWDIPNCTAPNHEHRNGHELVVNATKRLADLCKKVHEARPDMMFVVFSLPFDNHRLCAVDQQQISDTYSFPTIQSELIQRQQLYQASWEHPAYAIWGSWYGVGWHQAGKDNLKRPLRELIHAEMSMLGNGVNQAGGSFDLKQARPEFLDFLRKMFAWRRRFERYFTVYQHVLSFPDGKSVDGEGHIIDGKGFIILVNPTENVQRVRIPLSEPELELEENKTYNLYDWSDFENARPIGKGRTNAEPYIDLVGLEVKVIGIDISG